MNAAIYLRISQDKTGEQLGVDRQREDCLRLCRERGWTPVEYMDNDKSASGRKPRPRYEQMLSDIEDGLIGAVVCWDLDRLHRRPVELESFMTLADGKRIALATVSGEVDLSTAQGRLVARLKGSVAAHETEQKRARQLRAARQKAEMGRPNWRRAFGYVETPDGPKPDPRIAKLVRRAYKDVVAGASLREIANMWNDAEAYCQDWKHQTKDGRKVLDSQGKPILECVESEWTSHLVSLFLRKPRNAGLRAHTNSETGTTEIVGKGTWKPLVDEELWHRAQSVLNAADRKPGSKSVRRHVLTGLLVCGKCGSTLGGGPTNNGKVAYTCLACRGVTIRAEFIEPTLARLVGERLAAPDAADLLRSEVHDEAEAARLRQEKAVLYGRLDELAVERAEGLLTARQVQVASEVVQKQIDALESQERSSDRVLAFDGIPLGTDAARKAVEKLTPSRFRTVLAAVARVTILPVGKGHKTFKPERVQVEWL